jgi:hypothetical protein
MRPAPNIVRKSIHRTRKIGIRLGDVFSSPRKIARKPASKSIVSQPNP